jgi:hypothetical protein
VPDDNDGANGDHYLRTNGDVYEKADDTWTFLVTLAGPAGDDGAPGAAGAAGATGAAGSVWRTGAGAPSDASGVNGDYYLRSSNGDYYLKAAGTYSVAGNIKGATGAAGADGAAGAAGATGAAGTNGVPLAGINTQTASYTLVLADASKMVEINNASANNLTVPQNSSVAFPLNTVIDIAQIGAGQTTIVADTNVTIRSSGGKLKLTGQYSVGTLYKRATNEWVLAGDIAT